MVIYDKVSQLSPDTLHPKRRRTASSKAWEVELEQEEHSLSLSQHSSPSQSDQEQTPQKKSTESIAVSRGFHLFKQIPSNCHSNNNLPNKQKELRNISGRTRQDIQILGERASQPKLEQFLHVVPTGRQCAQYPVVEQQSLEGGLAQNLVSIGFSQHLWEHILNLHCLGFCHLPFPFVHDIGYSFLPVRLVLRSEVKLMEPLIRVSL